MKRKFHDLLLLVCVSTGITVMMDPKDESELNIDDIDEAPGSFQNVFAACVAKKNHGIFECINRGTLSLLDSLNNEDVLKYDCIKFEKAEGQSRNLLDLDYDPNDFGNVVQAAARLMERRNLRWDLSKIYPGLQMRVGPMLNSNGILEFVVDEKYNGYNDRQLGTGSSRSNGLKHLPPDSSMVKAVLIQLLWRKKKSALTVKTHALVAQLAISLLDVTGRMLVRSLVLPFLLGFKFSLSSLVPLIFGVILLVTKKALLLTKVALLLSGLLGWNSIVTGGQNYHQTGYPTSSLHPLTQSFAGLGINNFPAHDNSGEGLGSFYNHDHHYPYRPVYREIKKSPDFPTFGQHVMKETVNVYGSEKDTADQESSRNRKNFVWSTRQ